MIILWQNILGHQQGALNFLLTTIPNRNYSTDCGGLYYSTAVEIRKFDENREQRTENRQRIQLQRPLLSPVDRRGERDNSKEENLYR